MGKKRQVGPQHMDNLNDSSKVCDENQNASCLHIVNAVNLNKIRKSFQNGFLSKCPECEKNPTNNDILDDEDDPDNEYYFSLWLCLQCGNQACGQAKNKHALNHFKQPRSDCHALCINTTNWSVWCYTCDSFVPPNSKKKLLEVVEWLKKQKNTDTIKQSPVKEEPVENSVEPVQPVAQVNFDDEQSIAHLNLPRPRGLINLGNTCFFNAVIQCLAQTPFLTSVLKELESENATFTLPGGKIQFHSNEYTSLPPFSGTLEGWGSLTETLYYTLNELTNGRGERFNPRTLLSQMTTHQHLFEGDQQDAHELLRCLLDATRSEDLRRYQSIILDKLGFSRTDPNTISGVTKYLIKFYEQQTSDLMIKTDQIFRGTFVSILKCQVCKHVSHRNEYFFDLSLPIVCEKQYKKSNNIEPEQKPSKYQQKKEKRAARKARKKQGKFSKNVKPEQMDENKSDTEKKDTAVEDILEECKSPLCGDESAEEAESENNSETVCDTSSDTNNLDVSTDTVDPMAGAISCEYPDSPQSMINDINIELPFPQLPSTNSEDYDSPIFQSYGDDSTPMIEDKFDIFQPIPTMDDGDEDELSIKSCLNQFTSCELMTDANRVCCENCTKNSGETDKKVYTNANKQLLISSPPTVLILHLKRFHVSHRFPRKLNQHISFPLVLDMASYCTNKYKNVSLSGEQQQQKLLYSLYGVVEHSGTLHGGHYVGYVKVRPPVLPNHYRWQFLTTQNSNTIKLVNSESSASEDEESIVPPGKWYFVNDSSVTEIAESKVLKAQAYLLFYERIL